MLTQQKLQDANQRRPRLFYLAAFVAGAVTMLSFAPVGWYWLPPFLVLPLITCALWLSSREVTRQFFCYGTGLFLTGTYWLYTSIHVFGQAPLWVAMFLMLGLVVIMALFYAACGWLIQRFSGQRLLLFVIAAPACWVAMEWLRGWFLTGFPWMTLGYSQIDSPLAAFAPVIGVYGLSLLVVISSTALLAALMLSGLRRVSALAIAVLPWIAGVPMQQLDWSEPAGPAVKTTIVQGGISQDRKWLREQFLDTLNLYRASLAANADSQLIVWPEVALPATIDQVESYLQAVENDIARHNQTLLLGILERDQDTGDIYNSVLMLGDGRRQVYRKRHLVPFGEYFPVPGFIRNWMRMMNLPHSDLSAGDAKQPLLETTDGLRLAVAICYEDAYGAEQLYALPDAGILINVSNDAWFGDSIAPHQHLEIARMRALETGRSVVRSTNNGISAFIGPAGELLETGPQFEYVALTRDVSPMAGLSPYARSGNWPVIGICLLVMLALGILRRSAAA